MAGDLQRASRSWARCEMTEGTCAVRFVTKPAVRMLAGDAELLGEEVCCIFRPSIGNCDHALKRECISAVVHAAAVSPGSQEIR
ncbi:hypothetical protein RM50_02715 [Pseudarthrobacter phenanthrenivorans]|uniref:Uncharacterized protein n=1 Tax=Pseudarthrobacter phenanthrenivorans TaxID=361575 RepID=A0A0B4D7H0_PSEPS|nr:hypothetical protein RM50_02715 [Pseudarthrobacter phenanthrenivorans]